MSVIDISYYACSPSPFCLLSRQNSSSLELWTPNVDAYFWPPEGSVSQLLRTSGAVSARFCTRACWLAQTPTWRWALTNGVWGDRELLLRHFRGLGGKKGKDRNLSVVCFHHFTLTLPGSSPLCLCLSPCTRGPTALPAFYWLLVAESWKERRSWAVLLHCEPAKTLPREPGAVAPPPPCFSCYLTFELRQHWQASHSPFHPLSSPSAPGWKACSAKKTPLLCWITVTFFCPFKISNVPSWKTAKATHALSGCLLA